MNACRIASGCVLAALLLAACAPGARPAAPAPAAPASPNAPAAAPAAPAQGAPEAVGTAAPSPATMPLETLYERALAEGGTLSLYGSLNANAAPTIFAAFEQRYPGLKVEWVDGTSTSLTTRILTESRGGRVLTDVLQTNIEALARMHSQGLLRDLDGLAEAAPYPDTVKGPYWLASDLKFYVMGWNTNLVSPAEAPREFEDLGDPRWRNRLIGEPVDIELLVALAKHKYGSDEPALALVRRIAANNPEFHRGHSELSQFLLAGQGAVCITCFSHHFPPRMRRGAPVDYALAEGIGLTTANVILKDAPHPHTAWLWTRWVASEEGQRVYAEVGQTPAHPAVAPTEKTRPDRIYALTADDLQDYPRYERQWKEIFGLR